MDLVHEGRGGGIGRLGKQFARAIERFAYHFFHLVLRVTNEVPARMIEFRGELRGNLAGSLTEIATRLEPFAARQSLLVLTGSDHAPPDPTLPERLEKAARRLRAGLDARIGSLAEHLAHPAQGELPVCRGELRSAARAHLLPGVVSTRITQKQERADAEALLERYSEPLAALEPGFAWPERELEEAWRLISDEVEQRRTPYHARALATPDTVPVCRWVLGNRVRIGPTGADGRVEVELRGHNVRSLAGEIAGIGAGLEIVEPVSLREKLAEIAAELAALYK